MSAGSLAIAGLYAVALVAIGIVYGRQRRWHGLAGWALLFGGQVFLAFGGGDAIDWGGLLGIFVSTFGLLLVIFDIVTRRWR